MAIQLISGRIDWGQDSRGQITFPAGQKGLYMVSSKPASSPKIVYFYKGETDTFGNGNIVTYDAPNYEMYVGALNLNNTVYGAQTLRYGFFFISSELTEIEMQDFGTAINDLQIAFGRNTY